MTKRVSALFLCIVLINTMNSGSAYSQQCDNGKVICWLQANRISIKKALDGSRTERDPAAVSFSKSGSSDPFYNVDVGAVVQYGEPFANSDKPLAFVLYPSVEWHASANPPKRANKFNVQGNSDLYIGDLTKSTFGEAFLFKTNVVRDLENNTTGATVSLLGGPASTRPWLPMAKSPIGSAIFSYTPYAGFEYFDNLSIQQGNLTVPAVNAGTLTLRLRLNLYAGPFEIISYGYLRHRTSGSDLLPSNLKLFTLSVNLYFDRGRYFSVGYDYENGRNPQNNFQKTSKSSVALKFRT